MPKKRQKKTISIFLLIAIVLGICIWLLCSIGDNGCSCNDNGPDNGDKDVKPDSIKFFMETSLSVTAYLGDQSQFKSQMINMLSLAPHKLADSLIPIKCYVGGSRNTDPSSCEIQEVPINTLKNSLNEGFPSSYEYDYSHLFNLFDSVFSYTQDTMVSFLVTDCIPNFGESNHNHQQIMNQVQSKLTNVIQKFSKNEKGLAILKLTSNYEGPYYPVNGPDKVYLNDPSRPYYVFMFGKSSMLKYLLSNNSNFEALIENEFETLTFNVYNQEKIRHTLLWSCGKNNVQPRPSDNSVEIKNGTGNDSLSFLMGVDLQGLPNFIHAPEVLENKIQFNGVNGLNNLNIDVYEGKPPFSCPKETDKINSYSHFIQVSFNGIATNSKTDTISIQLPYFVAPWYQEVSTMEDYPVDSTMGKTFGFQPFVEGIQRSFGLDEKTFFSFEITIKK